MPWHQMDGKSGRRLVADGPFITDCCSLTSHSLFFKKTFFFNFLAMPSSLQDLVWSQLAGIKPMPQQWRHGVPTSGPSGNFLSSPLCVAQLLGWVQFKGRCWRLLMSASVHFPTPSYCLAYSRWPIPGCWILVTEMRRRCPVTTAVRED